MEVIYSVSLIKLNLFSEKPYMKIKTSIILSLSIVVMIIASYLAILVYFSWPIEELSIRQAALLGDSFGIVNSLFSGLAFAGIIITIALQRQELNESRAVFKSQKFEDAFYRLLDFYKENLNDITDYNSNDSKLKGIGVLSDQIRKIVPAISQYSGSYSLDYDIEDLNAQLLFSEINKNIIHQSRYLGTLESILYLIMNELENKRDRHFYLKILTSQLTIHEVKYIFYRCLVSKTHSAFVKLINDSRLIESRISESRINGRLIDLYNKNHGTEFHFYMEND